MAELLSTEATQVSEASGAGEVRDFLQAMLDPAGGTAPRLASGAGPTPRDLAAPIDQEGRTRPAESLEASADCARATPGVAAEDRAPIGFVGPAPVPAEPGREPVFDPRDIEALVPIYRIAHPAMELDRPQPGASATAVQDAVERWPELLSLTEQFRAALLVRMPLRDPPSFRAGELYLFAVCQLAAVGYVVVRGVDPVPSARLDGGLAAMAQLGDRVRQLASELLRATGDGQGGDVPVHARSVAEHAEVYRDIEDYVRVLHGEARAQSQAEPALAARIGDLDAAIDYGLLGQRIESAVRFLGSSHGLLHERLRVAVAGCGPRTALQDRLEAPIDAAHYLLLRDDRPLVELFQRELDVSRWLFVRAGEALPGRGDGASLDQVMKLDPTAQAVSRRRLAELFAHALPADRVVPEPICSELATVAADAFALERRCLRVVEREQAKLNMRLRRRAKRALSGADLAAYNGPRSGPALSTTLAEGLGISVTSDASTTVVRCADRSLMFTD